MKNVFEDKETEILDEELRNDIGADLEEKSEEIGYSMTKNEFASLLSSRLGITKVLGKQFIDEYELILRACIKEGISYRMAGIGIFNYIKRERKKERTMYNHLLKKEILMPILPPYSSVSFKVEKNLQAEIKEKTINKPFANTKKKRTK